MSRLGVFAGALLAAVLLIAGGLLVYLTPLGTRTAAPPLIAAQTSQPVTAQGITVIGEGSASARPDQAWISAGVQVSRPTAAEALAEANRATEAVLTKLDELGIARTDVQTADVSLFPIHEDGPRPQPASEPAIVGYRAGNQLTVHVRDLNQVGQVLDGVVAAGANNVGGVRFGLSDDTALRAQAIDEAIKAVRPKAAAMASGLNLTVGQVLAVYEEGGFSTMPAPAAQRDSLASVPIEPGELTVRVRVQVTFAITPAP